MSGLSRLVMLMYVVPGEAPNFIPSCDPHALQARARSHSPGGGGIPNRNSRHCRREHEDRKFNDTTASYPQKSLLALGEEWYSLGLLAQVTSEEFHPMQAITGEPLTL